MIKEFKKCPVCGSEKRFGEFLADEARKKGLAGKDWKFCYESRTGIVYEQNRAIILPIGTKAPAFLIRLDICIDCGTVYAIELGKDEAPIRMKELPKKKLTQ